jgi:hypothetical protein
LLLLQIPMYRKVSSWFEEFWTTDRGLSVFLAVLLVYMFLLPVVLPRTLFGGYLADGFFLLLLISGVAAASRPRWQTAAMLLTVFAAGVLSLANRLTPSTTLTVWSDVGSLAVLVLFSFIVIVQVFRGGRVTANRIKGAVAAYLLFGLTWANAYHLMASLYPGAFAGVVPQGTTFSAAWIYFSFVTLTTVGYGDITPVALPARSLTILEALTGQLYPSILIARLVSLELLHRNEDTSAVSRDQKGHSGTPAAGKRTGQSSDGFD